MQSTNSSSFFVSVQILIPTLRLLVDIAGSCGEHDSHEGSDNMYSYGCSQVNHDHEVHNYCYNDNLILIGSFNRYILQSMQIQFLYESSSAVL